MGNTRYLPAAHRGTYRDLAGRLQAEGLRPLHLLTSRRTGEGLATTVRSTARCFSAFGAAVTGLKAKNPMTALPPIRRTRPKSAG